MQKQADDSMCKLLELGTDVKEDVVLKMSLDDLSLLGDMKSSRTFLKYCKRRINLAVHLKDTEFSSLMHPIFSVDSLPSTKKHV